jgi:haloalkane dehalogenase
MTDTADKRDYAAAQRLWSPDYIQHSPQFSNYQYQIYLKGMAARRRSSPMSWAGLEAAASAAMDPRAHGYVFGSAGTEDTERENRAAFARHRIVPRMLRDVSVRHAHRDFRPCPRGAGAARSGGPCVPAHAESLCATTPLNLAVVGSTPDTEPTKQLIRRHNMFGAKPYGQLQFREVNGKRMAYVDEGQGDAIVFAHGNPTSSYLWRNVMPHLEGLGRLVAADMIGMGESDKLRPSGPDRYHYVEQRDYLFALWDALDLGDHVTLVLHDWGSVLGFDWANQHRDRVQGIAFMEAIVTPMTWSEFPDDFRELFQSFRTPQGEPMALEQNIFVEGVLPGAIQRQLSEAEMDHYRQPFLNPGEDRRPTLSWPRNIPIDGQPADVASVVEDYSGWLAEADVPKLFINAEPGAVVNDRSRELIRTWPNLTEITVSGTHFVQEDSPDEIGTAIADFVRTNRAT